MAKHCYWLGLSFLFFTSPTFGEEVLVRYEELRSRVEAKNLHVSAGRGSVEAVQKSTGFLSRSYLPNLNVEGGVEHYETAGTVQETQPYGGVSLNLNLFRGGRDAAEEAYRRAKPASAKANSESILFQELTKARSEYWSLVYNRELAAILRSALEQTQNSLESARKRFAAGLGSETDRFDFEMAQAGISQDLARAEVAALNAQRNLSVLIGLDQSASIATEQVINHTHDDALFALKLNPSENRDIRSLQFEVEAMNARNQQHRRWWFPSLDLYAGRTLYTFRERDYPLRSDRVDTFVGAKLTLTLFDGLQNRSEAAAARAEANSLENEAMQSTQELSARFESAKAALRVSHELIHEADAAAKLGQMYLQSTLSEYRRGLKNSPDVAGALSRSIELRRRSAEMRRDYQLAHAELLNLVGK